MFKKEKAGYYLKFAGEIFKIKFFKKRIPLFIRWEITDKCNYTCKYCGYWRIKQHKELKTKEVFNIIDQLSSAGTIHIQFTGGEPLIRNDLDEILEYCYHKGLYTGISTNGSLIKKNIHNLDKLDIINLSLDGPKEINDAIRGNGSYDNVLNAIKIAKEHKINSIEIATVLSDLNVSSIDYLLTLTNKLDVGIVFQSVSRILLGTYQKNSVTLSEKNLKKSILSLMRCKRMYNNLNSSIESLRYLSKYPDFPSIYCSAGIVSATIGSDGTLYICKKPAKTSSISDIGFDKAWSKLKPILCNQGCFCTKIVNMSLALSFNHKAVLSALSSIYKYNFK